MDVSEVDHSFSISSPQEPQKASMSKPNQDSSSIDLGAPPFEYAHEHVFTSVDLASRSSSNNSTSLLLNPLLTSSHSTSPGGVDEKKCLDNDLDGIESLLEASALTHSEVVKNFMSESPETLSFIREELTVQINELSEKLIDILENNDMLQTRNDAFKLYIQELTDGVGSASANSIISVDSLFVDMRPKSRWR